MESDGDHGDSRDEDPLSSPTPSSLFEHKCRQKNMSQDRPYVRRPSHASSSSPVSKRSAASQDPVMDANMDHDLNQDSDEMETINWMESDAVRASQRKYTQPGISHQKQKRPRLQKCAPSLQSQQYYHSGRNERISPRKTAVAMKPRPPPNSHQQSRAYDGLHKLYQEEKAYSNELFSNLESGKLYISKTLAKLEAEKDYSARLCKELVHEKSINSNLQKALKEEKAYSTELFQNCQDLEADHNQLQNQLKRAEARIKELEEGLLLPVQSASLRIQNGLQCGQDALEKISEAYDHFNQAQSFLSQLLPHVTEE